MAQTCCGQPAYNSGNLHAARKVARVILESFEDFDYVVTPSGSCAGMLRNHLSLLFSEDSALSSKAKHLSARTHEITSFLVDILNVSSVSAHYSGIVTYHDSCSALRELKIKEQPRKLLASVHGLRLKELPEKEECCGFGGAFCVKYPEISDSMTNNKIINAKKTDADTFLSADLGCLLNLAGKAERMGVQLDFRHIVEILAGMTETPPIGTGRP